MRYNLLFHNFSDGVEISELLKTQMINTVLDELKKGKTHFHSQTGNYCVVGLVYESEAIIIVTNNYKQARLGRDEL